MNPLPAFVLDSFAVLAHAQNEPGAADVAALLQRCISNDVVLLIPVVNLGEVFYRTKKQFGDPRARAVVTSLIQAGVLVVDVDMTLTVAAANIKASYRMGYLDCFVVALAQLRGATVLTGAPGFQQVANLVSVQWLPQR